jgi:Mrp family chromosome partitioning ATPase
MKFVKMLKTVRLRNFMFVLMDMPDCSGNSRLLIINDCLSSTGQRK